MRKFLVSVLCTVVMVGVVFAAGQTETGPATFKGKNVRVVIGSTATAGDSYIVAETVSRYLAKELGANLKVDPVGAARALDAMQTAKANGQTIMIFHDMTYLGISFGAYDSMYGLENMAIGPRVAHNPGPACGARADAPFKNMAGIPQYLLDNPDAIVRIACEAGGTSHIGFIVYWQWVVDTYGMDVAKRVKAIIGGSFDNKLQLLWDGNADVIFADYTSMLQYTQISDKKLAMKYVGLLDNIEGVDAESYADQGITLNDKEFRFSKDFIIYLPKDTPAELIDELDAAMVRVNKDPGYIADLTKMTYHPGEYLDSTEAKEYIYAKRDSLQRLIDGVPSMDDLVL